MRPTQVCSDDTADDNFFEMEVIKHTLGPFAAASPLGFRSAARLFVPVAVEAMIYQRHFAFVRHSEENDGHVRAVN